MQMSEPVKHRITNWRQLQPSTYWCDYPVHSFYYYPTSSACSCVVSWLLSAYAICLFVFLPGKSKEEAMKAYVDLVDELSKKWQKK